ncbi:DNA repair protein rad10 [Gonapodya prolifera JEL478]|uniref:DNA repair protein rad10 n=1 Tax=Gonapodya prolifera (strain JEL478) TaxID=1344416 RepID=A0A139ANF1_GONPJ|nr:DNA repair protein rad10 [Gonapodya prolifera JEL478]|eukprot:KXS18281.1 DNA repair protein rad10 [Gonapodya prolifera JEL478]
MSNIREPKRVLQYGYWFGDSPKRNLKPFRPVPTPPLPTPFVAPPPTQPKPLPRTPLATPTPATLLVSPLQRGNPLLPHLRNTPWAYAALQGADYQVGASAGVLYLSLKYHRLHPEYVTGRVEGIKGKYGTRVLLVLVDVEDPASHLPSLTSLCLFNALSLILATTLPEAARYLETFKAYEHKPPDALRGAAFGSGKQGRGAQEEWFERVKECVTSVKSVNARDAETLVEAFGSLKAIVAATPDELSLLPGIGQAKAKKLAEAFRQSFVVKR